VADLISVFLNEKDEAERKITALRPARDCNVQATKHRQLFVV
jgi:hypothetical protein